MSLYMPTVLLVGPAQDDRMMYADYLRFCGLNPIEIDNTAEALPAAYQADVIVTSIRVDGPFDGIELVRRLRDGDGTHDIPIIVPTASACEPAQWRALAAGCDRFLAKPCLPDRLVSEIRAILNGHALKAKPIPEIGHHRHRHGTRCSERPGDGLQGNRAMETRTLPPTRRRRTQPRNSATRSSS